MKKITFITILLLNSILIGQTTPNVYVNIDPPSSVCNDNQCIDLNANYFVTKETTNYSISSIAYNFIGNTGSPQLFLNDDSYSNVVLPFNFCFYGNSYSSIDVGANGLISFDSHPQNISGECPWSFTTTIPNSGFPIKNAIYAVYQDLNPQIIPYGTVTYFTVGAAPNRQFILTFKDMLLYSCGTNTGSQTSQVILYETTNVIDINILRRVPCNAWNSGNGVIGVQNTSGTLAVAAPGRNTGSWSANHESWRFSPSGNITSSITWSKNGVNIGTQNPINVCFAGDSGNEIFTATVTYPNCNGVATTISNNLNSPLIPVPNLQNPNDIILCNQNIGSHVIDLTQNTAIVLQGLPSSDYDVVYYTSQFNAENLINPITNPIAYIFNQNQTIYVGIESLNYGCIYTKSFQIEAYQSLLAPTGTSPQSFISGQTLMNLTVNGTNILWYDSSIGGNLLPNTTVLQNNMTYYASQSNSSGCQSKTTNNSRLAITVFEMLSNTQINSELFSIYPNPTKSILTISSIDTIDTVEIYNAIGQMIINKQPNTKETTLSLLDLNEGVYFLKINSNDKIKTIKIIKN